MTYTLLKNRYPFWYFERGVVYREDGRIVFENVEGKTTVPLADIGFLMLGSGCRITSNVLSHASRTAGCVVIASSTQIPTLFLPCLSVTGSGKLAYKQAVTVSSSKKRVEAAKKLIEAKYGDGAAVGLTRVREALGIDGHRMRRAYHSVFGSSFLRVRRQAPDDVNIRINVLYSALYSIAAATCHIYGLSPHLGVIHGKKRFSFVYDLADVFKNERYLELARDSSNVPSMLRSLGERAHKDRIYQKMERIIANVFNTELSEVATDFLDVPSGTKHSPREEHPWRIED